ncbi:MAG TPA: DJ-1/PfpI family protein [Spirochaetia bacterium]|nr:DJ-1/PfpI family protein [Spirochaetia bacterium]
MRTLLAVAAVLVALVAAPVYPAGQSLRIVMVVAPKDFTDAEYADPRAVFDATGAVVRVASISGGTAVGHGGARVRIDLTVRELALDQFDAIVVVGGTGALTYLMDDEALRKILAGAAAAGKVVAGICVAPAVLARAGILRNKQATCYPDKRIVTILKMNGADYTEKSVVTAGRTVTANGPEAAKDFARRVLGLMSKGSETKWRPSFSVA